MKCLKCLLHVNSVKDFETSTCKISINDVSHFKHLSDKFVWKTGDRSINLPIQLYILVFDIRVIALDVFLLLWECTYENSSKNVFHSKALNQFCFSSRTFQEWEREKDERIQRHFFPWGLFSSNHKELQSLKCSCLIKPVKTAVQV